MIVLSLRLILLFLILTSLFHLSYEKLKIDVHFIPVIAFSGIITILFFAGLLNVLFAASFIINGALLMYLVQIVMKKRLNYRFVSFGFVFAAALLMFFAATFRGTMFTAYDDFSHWGLLAREIVINDQLPNFETSFMNFPSYPPGSALFIYYISKIMGYSEGIMFFSQSILLMSGILPFFALVKTDKKFKYPMIILSAVLLLTANNHVYMLSVDSLLSVLAIAVLVILSHLHQIGELKRAPVLITPVLSVLIILKNSGVLFVFISLFVYIFLSYRAKGNKQLNKLKPLVMLFPFILSYLWGKHVEMVYSNGLETKHSFSVSNYRSVFGDKTPEDIREILGSLVERMVSLSESDVQIFTGILLTFAALSVFKRLNQKGVPAMDVELKLMAASLTLYLLYQVSLGGMYVFSMPSEEAFRLAGYDRYSITIVMYLFGLLLIRILRMDYSKFPKYSRVLQFFLLAAVSGFILAPEDNNLSHFSGQNGDAGFLRSELLEAKGGHDIPANEDVYLYYSDHERISDRIGYLRYVAKYDFSTYSISLVNASSIDSLLEKQSDFYLVFVDQDDVFDDVSGRASVLGNRIVYVE